MQTQTIPILFCHVRKVCFLVSSCPEEGSHLFWTLYDEDIKWCLINYLVYSLGNANIAVITATEITYDFQVNLTSN